MKEILKCFFSVFLLFLMIWPANAINIIERAEWWADEEYGYVKSDYWAEILKKRSEKAKTPATDTQRALYSQQKRIDNYLVNNFSEDFKVVDTQYYDSGNRLAWPIKKTEYVNAIMIHHTYNEYPNSLDWIQNIHKFHAVSRQWWDIWYHYLIWYNGEIYEWRAGGDYTVAAHAKNNNFSTVSISVIWNYEANEVSDAQYKALSSLVKHLTKKYGIDLSKRIPMHKSCTLWDDECEWDIQTVYHYPITWHLDGWHTSCPGKYLYSKLEQLRQDNLDFTKGFTPISYEQSLENNENRYGDILKVLRRAESKRLIGLIAHINRIIKTQDNNLYVGKLKTIRSLILQVLRERT